MARTFLSRIFPNRDRYYALLEEHGALLGAAGDEIRRLPPDDAAEADLAALVERLHQIKAASHAIVHEMTLALGSSLFVPLDREDMHLLSTQIDAVLGYVYAAAQAFQTYGVNERSAAMEEMASLLSEATGILQEALLDVQRQRFAKLATVRHRVGALERRQSDVCASEIRAQYRDAAVSAKDLLRHQSVLGALEAAMAQCQDAAEVIENIAIKHA